MVVVPEPIDLKKAPALLNAVEVSPKMASPWTSKVAPARLLKTALLLAEMAPVPDQVAAPALLSVTRLSVTPLFPLIIRLPLALICPRPARVPPVQVSAPST